MINYMLFHWEKESKVEKISGGKFYLANLLEFSSLVAKQAVGNKLLGPTWYNRTFQSRISLFLHGVLMRYTTHLVVVLKSTYYLKT